jgi:uncharacterized membrane protein YjgN (DUF898 family)
LDIDQPAPPGQPSLRALPFTFTGRAGEYFRIWFVNVCLTVLTLGIYSAWAKVRTRRYFYRNTLVDGHGFDYHARPITILKGRIIAVVVIGGSYALFFWKPLIGLAVFLGWFLIAPWVLNLASRFNARMTSYRNVRFGFTGSYGSAFLAVCLWPIIGVLPLGLLLPVAMQRKAAYLMRHYRFGVTPFEGAPSIGAFYAASLQGVGFMMLVGIVLFAVTMALVMPAMLGTNLKDPAQMKLALAHTQMISMMVNWVGIVFMVFFIVPFFRAKTRNAIFAALTLGPHRFTSRMSGLGYGGLVFSNFLLSVLTLGLLYPWAQIRQARYVAERTALHAATDLSEFHADDESPGSVAASELAALEGLAIGIGT